MLLSYGKQLPVIQMGELDIPVDSDIKLNKAVAQLRYQKNGISFYTEAMKPPYDIGLIALTSGMFPKIATATLYKDGTITPPVLSYLKFKEASNNLRGLNYNKFLKVQRTSAIRPTFLFPTGITVDIFDLYSSLTTIINDNKAKGLRTAISLPFKYDNSRLQFNNATTRRITFSKIAMIQVCEQLKLDNPDAVTLYLPAANYLQDTLYPIKWSIATPEVVETLNSIIRIYSKDNDIKIFRKTAEEREYWVPKADGKVTKKTAAELTELGLDAKAFSPVEVRSKKIELDSKAVYALAQYLFPGIHIPDNMIASCSDIVASLKHLVDIVTMKMMYVLSRADVVNSPEIDEKLKISNLTDYLKKDNMETKLATKQLMVGQKYAKLRREGNKGDGGDVPSSSE